MKHVTVTTICYDIKKHNLKPHYQMRLKFLISVFWLDVPPLTYVVNCIIGKAIPLLPGQALSVPRG